MHPGIDRKVVDHYNIPVKHFTFTGMIHVLDKTVQMIQLYDWYAPLLTEKQRDVFELYYHNDLSLAEIALELNVSRPAVHDILVRTENVLKKYEEALHLAHRFSDFSLLAQEAFRRIENSQDGQCEYNETGQPSLRFLLQEMVNIWMKEDTEEGV